MGEKVSYNLKIWMKRTPACLQVNSVLHKFEKKKRNACFSISFKIEDEELKTI